MYRLVSLLVLAKAKETEFIAEAVRAQTVQPKLCVSTSVHPRTLSLCSGRVAKKARFTRKQNGPQKDTCNLLTMSASSSKQVKPQNQK